MNSDNYDENELLEAIGKMAREEETEDAMGIDAELRPLNEGELANIVDGALGRLAEGAAPARVVSLGAHRARRRAQLAGAVTTALTLAAAALFVFWPSPGALPTYSAQLLNREQAVRSAHDTPAPEGSPIVLSEGSELRLALRPSAPVQGSLTVTVSALAANGERTTLQPGVEWADGGQALITGIVGETLPLSPGEYTLICSIDQDGATQRVELPLSIRQAR